ncbi:MAG: hypothetical protein DI609_04045 [Corynebacterium urealyticum]|uniref:HTH cro/C1-type domain-containing protein n=1 Tax=Corynebacterium urealyticum TaxID=43771 RepID=A0A2W5D2W2_9CORY|nr:MAG: hypothetical protein DI609_04045 [Corynebacterium urealyticum]
MCFFATCCVFGILRSVFNPESFGENVQAVREKLGWSRAEFQRRLEENGLAIHTTALRRIEMGEQEPRLGEAIIFSQTLCVPVETLGMDSRVVPHLATVQTTAALYREAISNTVSAASKWAELRAQLEKQIVEARAAGVSDKALFEAAELSNRFSDLSGLLEYWEITEGERERESISLDALQAAHDRWSDEG